MDKFAFNTSHSLEDSLKGTVSIAEEIIELLPVETALAVRRCIVLHWFDLSIVEALLEDRELTIDEMSDIYQQLTMLPFIDSIHLGLTFQATTRQQLLSYYSVKQPELLQTATRLAAPIYEAHEDEKNIAESFFCYIIAGDQDASIALQNVLLERGSHHDWHYFEKLFHLQDEAEVLPFVDPLPHTEHQLLLRGLIHRMNRQQGAALLAYNLALTLNPKSIIGYINRGITYAEQERFNEALNDYNTALRIDKNAAQAYANRGVIYAKQVHHREALRDFEKAIKAGLLNSFVLRYQGESLCQLGRYEEALASYSAMLSLDSKDVDAYVGQGQSYNQLENYERALVSFEEALRFNPDSATAQRGKGYALNGLKRYKEATAAYIRADELDSQHQIGIEAREVTSVQEGKQAIGSTRLWKNVPQRPFYSSDSSTVRATPPPPAMPNYANNTAYGIGNAYPAMSFNDQETIPAPPPAPPQSPYPNQTQYTPAQQTPYTPVQPPQYTPMQPPQYTSVQPPQYTPMQPPQYTPMQPPQYTPIQPPQYTPMQPPQYTPIQPPSQLQYTPVQPPPYMPSAQLPPQPSKKSPLRMIIIGVIAFLIVVGSIVGLAGYHNYQVGQDNTHATATALTASQHATATALAVSQQATAVAVASATAAATSQYPRFMHVALNDALTSGNDWGGSTTACQTSSTGLQISIQQVNTFQYCLHAGQYGDIAFQATMSITQGDCGGLDFRHIDAQTSFFFKVCQDGTYNIGENTSTQTILLYTAGDHTSSAIQQGLNKQNMLGVTVQGNTINVYVNGKNIDSATDTDLKTNTQGQVGLFAEDRGHSTIVVYTHALVWTAA